MNLTRVKFRNFKIILALPIIILVTACGSSSSNVATFKEERICEEVSNVRDFFSISDQFTNSLAIYNVKALGSQWTKATNQNLKDSLKEVSEYEYALNLKENYDTQGRFYLSYASAIELFYKFVAIDNACTNFQNIVNDGTDKQELSEIYLKRFGLVGSYGF
jgi:hypothetical protein